MDKKEYIANQLRRTFNKKYENYCITRTINLENCIRLVFTNDKDPLRLNLEKIIELRNTSTHFITEEYEMVYVPLFQSCLFNFSEKMQTFHNVDVTELISLNFLNLVVKEKALDENEIKAKYSDKIAQKLIGLNDKIEKLSDISNSHFAISLKDKKVFSEEMRTNLQAEASRIRTRLDKLTNEYYEDVISAEFYNEKRLKWSSDLEDIQIKINALNRAEIKYYEEGVRIIETLKHVYELYISQSVPEKRKMLDYLLSNITLNGEKVSYDYKLPFSYFVNFDSCRKKYPGCDSNA